MRYEMTVLNPVESLKKLSLALNSRDRFAYINIPKSSMVALGKNTENPFPAFFAKQVVAALKMSDKNMFKALSTTLAQEVENNKHVKLGLTSSEEYLYSNVFEYYYHNNKEIYDTVIDYFIRNTPKLVVTFHDKKVVQRYLGFDTHVITVPFGNYYSRLDNVYAQISEFEGGVQYCLMDCGLLGLALSPKIWKSSTMSILDIGKVLSLSKASQQQAA